MRSFFLITSNDDRNIQLCIVTMLLIPALLHQLKPRSMNIAKRSALLSGNDDLVKFLSVGFMLFPPIYGGFATTQSLLSSQDSSLFHNRLQLLCFVLLIPVNLYNHCSQDYRAVNWPSRLSEMVIKRSEVLASLKRLTRAIISFL